MISKYDVYGFPIAEYEHCEFRVPKQGETVVYPTSALVGGSFVEQETIWPVWSHDGKDIPCYIVA